MSTYFLTFSERMATVQRNTGLSQAEFCAKLGISERTYKNYLNEATDISSTALKIIAKEFGVDVRWLLLGQGFIDSQTLGDVVEAAVVETRTFFIENDIQLSPQQEAKIVRFFVQHMEEHGSISQEAKRNFFAAIT